MMFRTSELAQISESDVGSDAGSALAHENSELEVKELDLYGGRDKYLLSVVGNVRVL